MADTDGEGYYLWFFVWWNEQLHCGLIGLYGKMVACANFGDTVGNIQELFCLCLQIQPDTCLCVVKGLYIIMRMIVMGSWRSGQMDKDRQQANALFLLPCEPKEGKIYRVKEGQLYKHFQRSEFSSPWVEKVHQKKNNFKAAILLWPSGAFLCWKPHRGKHLTTTEMKQNTIGFSPHKSFCSNCRKLKIHRRTWKNYFAFCSGFCAHEIWFRSPSGHLKHRTLPVEWEWSDKTNCQDPTQATRMFQAWSVAVEV